AVRPPPSATLGISCESPLRVPSVPCEKLITPIQYVQVICAQCLTRSLGDRRPLPDYFVDSLEVCKQRLYLDLGEGDILLMCSDGIWEPLTEEEIAAATVGASGLGEI